MFLSFLLITTIRKMPITVDKTITNTLVIRSAGLINGNGSGKFIIKVAEGVMEAIDVWIPPTIIHTLIAMMTMVAITGTSHLQRMRNNGYYSSSPEDIHIKRGYCIRW
jgi:hypothetical protein